MSWSVTVTVAGSAPADAVTRGAERQSAMCDQPGGGAPAGGGDRVGGEAIGDVAPDGAR